MTTSDRRTMLAGLLGGVALLAGVAAVPGAADAVPLPKGIEPEKAEDGLAQPARWHWRRRRRRYYGYRGYRRRRGVRVFFF